MIQALMLALCYSALGLFLLAIGFVVVDALTTGSLGDQIYRQRSINAALVLCALYLSLGAVLFTVIWTNGDGYGGLGWALCFGLVGIALQAVCFLVLDALTPGSLRDIVVERELHPGALVTAAAMVAVGAVVCASIA